MSVGTSFEYTQRPFAAERIPGNPGGLWALQGAVAGDPSGGVRSITHLFQVLPTISNSQFYSIEQVSIQDTLVISAFAILQVNGMDAIHPGSQGSASNQQFWHIPLFNLSAANGPEIAVTGWNEHVPRPVFIGQPSQNQSLAALLVLTVGNSDGNTMRSRIQGYWWPTGAINVDGGLKRPVGSIYGS